MFLVCSSFQIAFRAKRANGHTGDIAIDDIKVAMGACPDSLGYSRDFARYLTTEAFNARSMTYWSTEPEQPPQNSGGNIKPNSASETS